METKTYELTEQQKFYKELGLLDIIQIRLSTDGFTRGALIECKNSLGANYGLSKAKKQAKQYSQKLMKNGEYLPFYFIVIDLLKGKAIVYENVVMDELDTLMYKKNLNDKKLLINYIMSNKNIKYDITEDTAIGVAQKYYKDNPGINKQAFFEAIQSENDKCNTFVGTERDFRSIMDKLNDPLSQKVLGAFYTPDKYVKIATQYVLNAVKDVKTHDYVIIDRCAGTGNLEKFLPSDVLSHCIFNTYEAKEWIALTQIYAGRVRMIIPPQYKTIVEDLMNPEGTLMEGGDALQEDFLKHFNDIFELRDKGLMTIIMLENPPFKDVTSKGKVDNIKNENKKNLNNLNLQLKGAESNQIDYYFIASAYKYFKPQDYILIAPIKYWKNDHIIDKTFIEGYISNREFYGASKTGLPIIHWKNIECNNNSITLDNDYLTKTVIKKIYKSPKEIQERPDNYFAVIPFQTRIFNQMSVNWLLNEVLTKRTMCSWSTLNKNNLLRMLPIAVAGVFPIAYKDYTEADILMKSADGGTIYQQDKDFLNDCLFYTLLTNKNKCSKTCEIYPYGFSIFNQKTKHNQIMFLWQKIYNKTHIYGLNNIIKELDIKDEYGNYIDDVLHSNIIDMKQFLKDFYIEYIRPKMLKYELVK